jgi:hypothetical protein
MTSPLSGVMASTMVEIFRERFMAAEDQYDNQ